MMKCEKVKSFGKSNKVFWICEVKQSNLKTKNSKMTSMSSEYKNAYSSKDFPGPCQAEFLLWGRFDHPSRIHNVSYLVHFSLSFRLPDSNIYPDDDIQNKTMFTYQLIISSHHLFQEDTGSVQILFFCQTQ